MEHDVEAVLLEQLDRAARRFEKAIVFAGSEPDELQSPSSGAASFERVLAVPRLEMLGAVRAAAREGRRRPAMPKIPAPNTPR